jgi:hypothetical protein
MTIEWKRGPHHAHSAKLCEERVQKDSITHSKETVGESFAENVFQRAIPTTVLGIGHTRIFATDTV